MKALYALIAVGALIALALLGTAAAQMQMIFGVVLVYVAVVTFLGGIIYKVVGWAKTPVPFRIPTTAGQQLSHDWIRHDKLDNPATPGQTVVRMFLEILLFRSLFRNLTTHIQDNDKGVDARVTYSTEKLLWLSALLFHYSFLMVFIRHFRLFIEPVPACLQLLEFADGFLEIGVPTLYISDLTLLAGVLLLLLRRFMTVQVRYISLVADYFPLFLILGIACSGIMLRYFMKTDVMAVKELTMGLVTLQPVVPEGIHPLFYVHIFLVSVLLMYFPFSKLMHMGGVFLSPTRNLPNDSRKKRHINPWNDESVKAHSYEAYEEEFREKMVEAGLPVDISVEDAARAETQ